MGFEESRRMQEAPDGRRQTEDEISRRAAEWFALLLDGSETASDRQGLREWLLADERHAKAYSDLERLWSGAGIVHDLGKAPSPSRRTVLKTGGAAMVLAGAVWGSMRLLGPAAYSTGTGETASVTLPDGSVATLSTRTALTLDFDAERRRIILGKGEAFFKVAPDASRPFVVEASDLFSTALGTAFSVGFQEDGIAVTVTEHAVSVSTGDKFQRVEQGQSLIYRDGRMSVPLRTDVETQLSWRSGKLVFLSTPFRDVISSLSRWRTGKIIVMDERLAQSPVTIIVDVKRSDTILDTLALGLPIKVQNLSPWLTFIYPR
jgi:transmembrane sensor